MMFKLWGFEIGKLSVVWRDVWLNQWCFELTWNHKTILPRPKPVKLTVCGVNGETKGTFIPEKTSSKYKPRYLPLENGGGLLIGDDRDWPEIIE